MKLLRFSLNDLKYKIIREKQSYLNIIAAITLTVSIVLLLLEGLNTTYQTITENRKQNRIYSLELDGICSEDSFLKLRNIFEAQTLPSVSEIPSFFVNSQELISLSDSSYINFYAQVAMTELKTEETIPALSKGEWFSSKTMDASQNYIILCQEYYDMICPNADIGEAVTICQNTFILCGISYSLNYIPFSCFENLINMTFSLDNLYYEAPLTKSQLLLLEDLCKELDADISIEAFSSAQSSYLLQSYIGYFIIICFLIIMCSLNTVVAFKYIALKTLYDLNVYKICGIHIHHILYIYYMQLCIIVTFSHILGTIIYRIFIPAVQLLGISSVLSGWAILLTWFLVIFISFIANYPLVKKLVSRPAVDRTFWR